MNKLIEFIESRPALNKSGLAKEMSDFRKKKVSPSYFSDMLYSKNGKKITIAFAFDLASILTKYGLELDGWMFEKYDAEYPLSLFAFKWKDSEDEIESIDKKDHFEYKRTFYRELWDTADFFFFITNQ